MVRYVLLYRVIQCSERKFSNIRSDTLAQLMAHGGVYPGSKLLVFETCNGLITGSAAYRMGGMFSVP
jgi:hypothetical protein